MSYKNSSIYQLAYQLALNTEELCRTFPAHERYSLAQQLRNSSRSVVANFVEGYIRQGRLPFDHRGFLIYSQGSCDESKYWLEFGKDIGLVENKVFKELHSGYGRVSIALVSLIRKTDPR
jgi:four helix bundle protein